MAAVLRQLLTISGYETPTQNPPTTESRSQDGQTADSGERDVGIEIPKVQV